MNCRPRGEKTVYFLPLAHSRLSRHYYEQLFLLCHSVPVGYRRQWTWSWGWEASAGIRGFLDGMAAEVVFLSLPSGLSATHNLSSRCRPSRCHSFSACVVLSYQATLTFPSCQSLPECLFLFLYKWHQFATDITYILTIPLLLSKSYHIPNDSLSLSRMC